MASVAIKIEKGVAFVCIDDGKANAINGELLKELDAALTGVEKDGLPVVLHGRDGFFSGGLDLKRLPGLPSDELLEILRHFGEVMLRLFTYRRPLVGAITGHAIAGGMVMALGCDERYGVHGPFRLGLNETQIGLTLPRFVVEMARAQLTPSQMRPVVIEGELFSPTRAESAGLLDGVLEPSQVLARAAERARALAALPATSFGDNKLSVRGPFADLGRTAYQAELATFSEFFKANAPSR